MRQHVRTIIGFMALALLLVAAVPFVVTAETARPRNVGVSGLVAQMAAPAPSSYRFTMAGSIADATSGDQVLMAVNGEQVGTDQTHLTLTLNGAGLSGTPPIEVTRVGNDLYVFLTGVLSPSGTDQWVLIDGQTSGLAQMMPQMLTSNPLDGAMLIAGLSGSGMGQTQMLPDETVNGVLTTHARFVPDANAVGSQLAGSGVSIPNATMDVFVGKTDNLVRRITLNTQAIVDPNAVSAMLNPGMGVSGGTGVSVTANIAFTADFTDFNNAGITVTAPANAVPLTDITGPLPAGGIGGPGGAGGTGSPRVLPTGVPRR